MIIVSNLETGKIYGIYEDRCCAGWGIRNLNAAAMSSLKYTELELNKSYSGAETHDKEEEEIRKAMDWPFYDELPTEIQEKLKDRCPLIYGDPVTTVSAPKSNGQNEKLAEPGEQTCTKKEPTLVKIRSEVACLLFGKGMDVYLLPRDVRPEDTVIPPVKINKEYAVREYGDQLDVVSCFDKCVDAYAYYTGGPVDSIIECDYYREEKKRRKKR